MRSLSDNTFVFGLRGAFCKSGGSARKVVLSLFAFSGTKTAV
jgi:hypothetical protein